MNPTARFNFLFFWFHVFLAFFDCWIFVTLKLPGSFPGPSSSLVFKEATVMSESGEEAAFPAEIGNRGSRGIPS